MTVEQTSKRVILADDNEDTRDELKAMLIELGYLVLEVRDSKDAVVTALSENPCCMLLDLDSNENDWFETALTIRGQKELSKIPILLTSRDGGRGIHLYKNIEEFGDDLIEYLPQPISINKLEFHLGSKRSQSKDTAGTA